MPETYFNEFKEDLRKFKNTNEKIKYLCKTYVDFLSKFNVEKRTFENTASSLFKIMSGVLATVSALSTDILTDIFNVGIKNGEYTLDNAEFTAIACVGVLKEFASRKAIFNEISFSEDKFEELIIKYFEQILNVKLEG